jgi:hypothetical protein
LEIRSDRVLLAEEGALEEIFGRLVGVVRVRLRRNVRLGNLLGNHLGVALLGALASNDGVLTWMRKEEVSRALKKNTKTQKRNETK